MNSCIRQDDLNCTLLSILIGGKLMGITGIIIAVPVAAAIGVLLREFVKIKETEALK